MRGRGLDYLLTGTALALARARAGPATAAPDATSAAIEALVPVPEPANVPPPTIADIGGPATASVTPKDGDMAPAAPAAAPSASPAAAPAPAAAPTPAAPPKEIAATPPAPLDPVAEKLRELLAGKVDRLLERKIERKPIEAFYAARNFAPLWTESGAANARAKAAIARLKQADADGLDPSDYPTPDFAAASTPDALAEADIRLTSAVLIDARHASTGRVHYSRVSADIVYNLVPPEPADVLGKMAEAKDAGETLGSYNTPHEGYRLVREKLAQARR